MGRYSQVGRENGRAKPRLWPPALGQSIAGRDFGNRNPRRSGGGFERERCERGSQTDSRATGPRYGWRQQRQRRIGNRMQRISIAAQSMQFFVGTSGYSYPKWKGSFYPNKLPPKQMLSYYAGQFAAVEI